jgi:hypothetical protein
MNFDPKKKPDFAAWHQDTLAKFADEAYDLLCAKGERIVELEADLKTALKEVRRLMTTGVGK